MKSEQKTKVSGASIVGLILVFLFSCGVGYFATPPVKQFFVNNDNGITEPNVSLMESLKVTVIHGARLDKDGLYEIDLGSNWKGSEEIVFDLYLPSDTNITVATSNTGSFNHLEYVDAGFYYVRARVDQKGVFSRLYKLNGFVKPEKPNPLKDVTLAAKDVASTKDNTYSFSVPFNNTDGKTKCVLYKSNNDSEKVKTSYSSTDGRFSNVAVERNTSYFVRLETEVDGESVFSDYVQIKELKWVAPKVAMEKLTEAEVEKLINENDRTTLLKDKHFSNSTRVVISNVNETSANWKSLDNFMQQKRFAWKSVIVEGLVFGTDNKIQEIQMTVNY